MKLILDGIDVFNPIDGKIDDLIELFVNFQGEKYRDKITKNIKNTFFIFLPKSGTYSLSLTLNDYIEDHTLPPFLLNIEVFL